MSTVRRGNRGLGRGLGNLIPVSSDEETENPVKAESNGESAKDVKKSSLAKADKKKTGTMASKSGTKSTDKAVPSETAVKTRGKTPTVNGQVYIKVTDIEPNKDQPRKIFDENALTELAQSIKEVGVIQPIVVQKNGEFYKIIAGERRWLQNLSDLRKYRP